MKKELNKITYILGAGASADALPTVRATSSNPGYTDSLRELATALRTDTRINSYYRKFCDEFCDNLDWLANQGDEHKSVDAFAHYCLRPGWEDYPSVGLIKTTLSLFFSIKQFIEKKIDKRYRHFLLKLRDGQGNFPDNVKILNWNYDYQVQIAAEDFKTETFTWLHGADQHSPPHVPYYPSLGNEFHTNNDIVNIFGGLAMVHLNGIAGFYYYGKNAFILNHFLNHDLNDLNQLFEKYLKDKDYKLHLLTFAFEKHGNELQYLRQRLPYTKRLIESTDYLVIIGYSFPYDNDPTDSQIFELLKAGGLKGIYFQDPYKSGDFLRRRFGIPDSVFIEHISDADNFHIPFEVMRSK